MTDGRKPYSNLEIFDVVTYLLSSPNAHVQIDEDWKQIGIIMQNMFLPLKQRWKITNVQKELKKYTDMISVSE